MRVFLLITIDPISQKELSQRNKKAVASNSWFSFKLAYFCLINDRQILIFYSYRQKLVNIANDDEHQIGMFFYV